MSGSLPVHLPCGRYLTNADCLRQSRVSSTSNLYAYSLFSLAGLTKPCYGHQLSLYKQHLPYEHLLPSFLQASEGLGIFRC